ncbi:MAG: redoxin domain-containing protein [Saprospiraceae bacterium]|nr:redoxin domain-containing protein [Saprospiraceae bacterium]
MNTNIVQEIPESFLKEAEAARAWFSEREGIEFKVTGIVKPEKATVQEIPTGTREIQLILCGNQEGHDLCLRERFELTPFRDSFEVRHLYDTQPISASPAPLLDPPKGTRTGWIDTVLAKHEFIVLVFYRGFWCPPCRLELLSYQKNGIINDIRKAGGEIYGITSEPHTLAENAHKEWRTDFNHIGDPHHEILADIHNRGWLSLFIWNYVPSFRKEVSQSLSHPKGIYQPGVLGVNREGRVLYRWRSVPSNQNIGGAISRVTALHVWNKVKEAILKPSETPDSPLDQEAELDIKSIPFPFFLLILFANGWFIRPNYFVMSAKGQSLKQINTQIRVALRRVALFIIFWISFIILLPIWVTVPLFLVWGMIVAPQSFKLYKSIQLNNEFGETNNKSICKQSHLN